MNHRRLVPRLLLVVGAIVWAGVHRDQPGPTAIDTRPSELGVWAPVAYTWLGHAGREALAGDASAIRYGLSALGLLAAIAVLPRPIRRTRPGGTDTRTEPDGLSHDMKHR